MAGSRANDSDVRASAATEIVVAFVGRTCSIAVTATAANFTLCRRSDVVATVASAIEGVTCSAHASLVRRPTTCLMSCALRTAGT